VVNTTFNKFGKKLPPVKTGQRFGEEVKKDKKVGLFSERRFLIFTKKGPIEIAFKPLHYTSVLITTIIGLTSIVYWSAKGIHSAINVAKKNDIITEASANINDTLENDSDTNVNINIEDQSNITLPILKKVIVEVDKVETYKPIDIKNENVFEEENKLAKKLNFKEFKNKFTTDSKNKIIFNSTTTIAKDINIDLFNKTKRNQDIPNGLLNQLPNESNIFISENYKSKTNKNIQYPQPPKLNDKVKSLRFIASVDNELVQMENVFKAINVKLKNNDLVSVDTIIKSNETINPDSDDFFRSLKKRLYLLAIYREALQNLPLKPPMEHYYVSSPYGPRKHPVTGKYRMHHGIDLAGTWQENVSVSADGTVVFAGYHGSFGKVIRIRHNYGIMTTYGHLAKINVRRGDIVNEGQVIGKMGRTGKVKGAHLHYEISVNGKSQNPATYIKIGRNLLSRTSLKGYANKSK
tara:strand:+ start:178 stop:1569 length:1392 start_codon:yes stop_codon:yes gene_type:complete